MHPVHFELVLIGWIVSTEMGKILNTDNIWWEPGCIDVCTSKVSWELRLSILSVHVSSSSYKIKQGEEMQAFPDFTGKIQQYLLN